MAKNEEVFIHLWCKYYLYNFDSSDIYLFDNGSTDNTKSLAKSYNINVLDEPHPNGNYNDHEFIKACSAKHHKYLLSKYDVVIFAELDELVIPNLDMYDDLKDYVEKELKYHHHKRCAGFELIHSTNETPYNKDLPLFQQRNNYWRNKFYNKTLISKFVPTWWRGHHYATEQNKFLDNVNLIHLHYFDFDICNNRRLERIAKEKSEEGLNGYDINDSLKAFIYNYEKQSEPVPDYFKKIDYI